MAGGGKELVVRRVAPVLLRMVREHQDRTGARDKTVVEPGDLSGDAA